MIDCAKKDTKSRGAGNEWNLVQPNLKSSMKSSSNEILSKTKNHAFLKGKGCGIGINLRRCRGSWSSSIYTHPFHLLGLPYPAIVEFAILCCYLLSRVCHTRPFVGFAIPCHCWVCHTLLLFVEFAIFCCYLLSLPYSYLFESMQRHDIYKSAIEVRIKHA